MPRTDSKNYSTQFQQQNIESRLNPNQFEEDTIDLYEIVIALWKSRWLIIAVTVFAAIGSIIYSLQQQNIYKVQALMLPPNPKDFQSVNYFTNKNNFDKNGLISTQLEPNDIFNKFKQNLNSRTLHKKFINEKGIFELLSPKLAPESLDVDTYLVFSNLVKLSSENGVTSLSIELDNPEIAANWVNDLIKFIDKETISMLVDDIENEIENEIKNIEYSINSKRFIAEKRREDQIIRYYENASIAKELGMIGRVDTTNISQNIQMDMDITSAATPLYYLGYEALMTEIKILKKRKSDDPFILGLRDLQEELAKLSKIEFDKENMSAVHIDQAAFPTKNPIKPNRRLTVSLATVVGFFSGLLLVFFIEFVKKERKKHSA